MEALFNGIATAPGMPTDPAFQSRVKDDFKTLLTPLLSAISGTIGGIGGVVPGAAAPTSAPANLVWNGSAWVPARPRRRARC